MKKKLKLKRWVKVLTTLIVIGLGILIYSKLGDIGSEATTNTLASILCIMGWTYLLFVQIVVLSGIWEN